MIGVARGLACASLFVLTAAAPRERFEIVEFPQANCLVGGKAHHSCYRRVVEADKGVDVIGGLKKLDERYDAKAKRFRAWAELSAEDLLALAPGVGLTTERRQKALGAYRRFFIDRVSVDPDQDPEGGSTKYPFIARINFIRSNEADNRARHVDVRGELVVEDGLAGDLKNSSLDTLAKNSAYALKHVRVLEVSNSSMSRADIEAIAAPAVLAHLWFRTRLAGDLKSDD